MDAITNEPDNSSEASVLNARVFFIVPHFINNSSGFVECDFKDHWVDSAISAGLVTKHFWGDLISYPGLIPVSASTAAGELTELFKQICDFYPDAIFFDACFIGNDKTVNPEFLNMVKAKTGAKCIGFMADAWGNNWKTIGEYWKSAADLLVQMMPPIPDRPASLYSSPYPCNPKNFYSIPEEQRDIDISFFGTSYNWRVPFLQEAIKRLQELGLKCAIRGHNRTNDCPDMAGYANIMRRSKMVMDFTMRYTGEKIITGRAWQALSSGCLLLEEGRDPLNFFFNPDEHYVTFNTPHELCALIQKFAADPEERQRIARAGWEHHQENYTPNIIWSDLLMKAFAK